MVIRFELLSTNPVLLTDAYYLIKSAYLQQILPIGLYLPRITDKPFIYSCFALSVDGRLAYPDLMHGAAIAAKNTKASKQERNADYWSYMLSRTISDAIIVGSNTVVAEQDAITAEVKIAPLNELRTILGKNTAPVYILITRNLSKIDFSGLPLCWNNKIPLIILTNSCPTQNYPGFIINHLDQLNLNITKQILYTDNFPDLAYLINKLYQNGIKMIANESPYYHHALQEQRLLDEAWINTSGVYIGGEMPPLGAASASFTSISKPYYTILTLYKIGYNFLYTRYMINYPNVFP